MVVQLESRDYFADHIFAVFKHVSGALVYLHTSVAGHVYIDLWLGTDVLLHSIFVGSDELIVKTKEFQQYARQVVWPRLKVFYCALEAVIKLFTPLTYWVQVYSTIWLLKDKAIVVQ